MTSAPTAPSLPFPHPVLTPITDGPPTLVSIKTLQRQLYANAKSIPTTLGGGANGYLALVMPDADYLARAGVAFPAPPHPGDQPIHAAAATAAQITEANRQYDRQLTVHSAYTTVKEELKCMILLAVPDIYLNTISDATFGYADITPQRLLTHLVDTYATVDEDDIENNRKTLEAPWNPDDPIEMLWTRILNAQQYATAAAEPIPDAAAIRLTLAVLEATGVFANATDKWRDKPTASKTLVNFKSHFNKENKERQRLLTAKTAGFHGAHATTEERSTTSTASLSTLTDATSATKSDGSIKTNNGVTMYYCHSHGLGKNRGHTSLSCKNKKDGHQDTATADNMMGGCDRIMKGSGRSNPQQSQRS